MHVLESTWVNTYPKPSAAHSNPLDDDTVGRSDNLKSSHLLMNRGLSKQRLTRLQQIAQNVFLHSLHHMRQGHLQLTLPDHSILTFGSASANLPSAEIVIQDGAFFSKIIAFGHIGFGEAYVEGLWDTPDLEAVIQWALLNVNTSPLLEGSRNKAWYLNFLGGVNRLMHRLQENSLSGSRKNIRAHYDLSNAFFSRMLDPTMMYSSAWFEEEAASCPPAETLQAAQIKKIDRLAQALHLSSDDHVLEIGSGWGGLACHVAKTYGCRITTVTISEAQYNLAKARIDAEGLSNRIDLQLKDYRELSGQFDKIISVEMVEALGDQYFDLFFDQCTKLLKPDGLLGIQMITCPDARYELLKNNVDFIQKHIFPGSLLPSISRVLQALGRAGDISLLSMEDFGLSYAKTLRVWNERFLAHASDYPAMGLDETFMRKWHYYLMYCAAAFQMRNISVVQAIFTRPNNLRLNQKASGKKAMAA
ncbi:MAG: cyclopropane-fatty-acyl-phospholipid synthase family protein [Vampirovibrionales bacterium]|nr:cyclopropane-fatty-acyl-phospholipid synthase family protein [Vampirovibrionales bacterium]